MVRTGLHAKTSDVEGIGVFVRVRPARVEYGEEESSQVVDVDEHGQRVSVRNTEQPSKAVSCGFDRVFGPDATQNDVFSGLMPALETVLQGFNACVLAYGQTGSGKTHTLIGPGGGTKLTDDASEWGIIPQAVQFLFDRLAAASQEDETFAYSVSCSFLQIYNENLVDLLQEGPGRRGPSLQIREEPTSGRGEGRRRQKRRTTGLTGEQQRDTGRRTGLYENRRVFVSGLSSFRVSGAEDVLRYVSVGAANRRMRATQHNEASSRSHAVMQLLVEAETNGIDADRVDHGHVVYRQAKLSLVDLAGSEKMDSALKIAKGHFNELRHINQSLSALGNVVSALSEKGRKHVPYRDSKLTRLLQDSLGGNTRTTIIACVNPLATQTNETVNTLMFADRAKKVMVRLRPNEVVDDRILLARAQAEILRLKELLRQALGDATATNDASGSPDIFAMIAHEGEQASLRADSPRRAEGSQVSVPSKPAANEERESAADTKTDKFETASEKIAARWRAYTPERRINDLVGENDLLREDNKRLREDVKRLLHSRQRLKRRRRGARSVTPVRGAWPPTSSVDWSQRYADAVVQARRSRPRLTCPSPAKGTLGAGREERGEAYPSQTRGTSRQAFVLRVFDDDDDDNNEGHVEEALTAEEMQILADGEMRSPSRSDAQDTSQEEDRHFDSLRRSFEGRVTGNSPGQSAIETDIGSGEDTTTFLAERQQLEDTMFEVQRCERRQLKEERARLASARAERLALEAQLAELERNIALDPAVDVVAEALDGQAAVLSRGHESGELAATSPKQTSKNSALPTVVTTAPAFEPGRRHASSTKYCWTDAVATSSFRDTSPLNAAANDLQHAGQENSGQRNRTWDQSQEGNVADVASGSTAPEPKVPDRQTRYLPPRLTSRSPCRRRPATSVGLARTTRSSTSRRKAVRSRFPSEGRSTKPEAAAPGAQDMGEAQRPRVQDQAVWRPAPRPVVSAAKVKTLEATYPHTSPGKDDSRRRKVKHPSGEHPITQANSATGTGLAYGIADLGLRLKVYSFRYDHHYECQVIGYDPKRRMHRCAYDATGEKQWHDLAKKRFEVVGQNGVIVRSTESAP